MMTREEFLNELSKLCSKFEKENDNQVIGVYVDFSKKIYEYNETSYQWDGEQFVWMRDVSI